jgi:outer membrane biosynthesis protein TonB
MDKARDEADTQAVELAVNLTDTARFLASEIEGASTEVTADLDGPSSSSDPSGQIDSEALRDVFNEHRSEMQQCYERALKTSTDLAGRVILEVDIGPDGSASRVVASGDTLDSQQVNTCLERTARQWTFPEPTGGTARVRKPFTFSPKN